MNTLRPSSVFRTGKYFILAITFIVMLINCKNSKRPEGQGLKETKSEASPSNPIEDNKGEPDFYKSLSADSVQILLKGKWLRSDGTYAIEIFTVSENGGMDAGYFNPNPINVGKSGWNISDGHLMLEVILKDANYPGSKYNLIYDNKSDCLTGNYFQAVQGINYDVLFQRMK